MLFRGYTVLSLMISLSLSSLLLLVAIAFYVDVQRQNRAIHFQMQLQAELERVIQLMGKDIRRAGFRAPPETTNKVNFSLFESETQAGYNCSQYMAEMYRIVFYFFMIWI